VPTTLPDHETVECEPELVSFLDSLGLGWAVKRFAAVRTMSTLKLMGRKSFEHMLSPVHASVLWRTLHPSVRTRLLCAFVPHCTCSVHTTGRECGVADLDPDLDPDPAKRRQRGDDRGTHWAVFVIGDGAPLSPGTRNDRLVPPALRM
jgi:hypothetical protein